MILMLDSLPVVQWPKVIGYFISVVQTVIYKYVVSNEIKVVEYKLIPFSTI
jgi:type III secretory pathway component EscS